MEMSTYIAVDRAIGREAVKRLNEGKVKGRKVSENADDRSAVTRLWFPRGRNAAPTA
jgi:hypothetical protein